AELHYFRAGHRPGLPRRPQTGSRQLCHRRPDALGVIREGSAQDRYLRARYSQDQSRKRRTWPRVRLQRRKVNFSLHDLAPMRTLRGPWSAVLECDSMANKKSPEKVAAKSVA